MSDITPEQIAQKQKDERDMAAFNTGLTALIEKTGITIVPKIAYGEDGIRPALKLVRLAHKSDAPEEPVQPKKKNAKAKKK